MFIGLSLAITRGGVLGPGGPTNTVAPVVSGTTTVGQTLSSTTGTWTGEGSITYAYQWFDDGAAISGATSSTYTLQAAEEGGFITCRVTATDNNGSTAATSNSVGPVAAAPSFDPATLFASGEEGAWYDIAPAYLYQNSDGTGAVSVGDPVGYVTDRSGNGNHLLQATSSQRPVLRQDGSGNYYLEFDGVDDHMRMQYSASTTEKTLAISYYQDNGYDMPVDDYNTANGCSLYIVGTTCRWKTTGDEVTGSGGGWAASGATQYAIGVALSDGSHLLTGSGNSASGTGSAPTSLDGLTVGMAAGNSQHLAGRIYSVVDIDRELTSGEKANLATFVAGTAGISA